MGISDLGVVLAITNRARRSLQFEVEWELGADYADIQEAQSGRGEQEAAVDLAARDSHVECAYRHTQLPFRTELHHDGRWTLRGSRVVATVSLEPKETTNLSLRIVPSTGNHDITAQDAETRATVLHRWHQRFARLEAPGNRLFERVVANNVRDIGFFPAF